MFNKNIKKFILIMLMSFLCIPIILGIILIINEFSENQMTVDNKIQSSYQENIITIPVTTITTTTITTTITTLTTTSTSLTTISTTNENLDIEENTEYYEEYEDEKYEEYYEEYEDEECYEESTDSSMTYSNIFTAKWYDNRGLGYSEDSILIGSSGRDLISGYSVASNYFASGTILYIKGGCHDGYYQVDDTGYMSDNVIDFYYQRRSDVPSDFLYDGVYDIEVYIIN